MIHFEMIGIDGRDKRVYECLLKNERLSIRKLSEQLHINRGSVYESIKKLLNIGLVTYVPIGKRQYYIAQDPEILHELINEKQQSLQHMQDGLSDYITSLRIASPHSATTPKFVTFYEDNEGLAAILRDVLQTCRTQKLQEYRVISSPRISSYLYNNFPTFNREREKLRLKASIIGLSKPHSNKESRFIERRIIPHNDADTSCYVLLYGTKVAQITTDRANNASGIIIDNSGVAHVQNLLFDTLWQVLRKNENE